MREKATPVLGNAFTSLQASERDAWVTVESPTGAFAIQQLLLVPIQQVLVPNLSSPTRFLLVAG